MLYKKILHFLNTPFQRKTLHNGLFLHIFFNYLHETKNILSITVVSLSLIGKHWISFKYKNWRLEQASIVNISPVIYMFNISVKYYIKFYRIYKINNRFKEITFISKGVNNFHNLETKYFRTCNVPRYTLHFATRMHLVGFIITNVHLPFGVHFENKLIFCYFIY